ncbi:uncharacterized protein EV154DRAFT_547059 [Mucor mucedo]|uniref:uncharacterized protein n=1 Tax=Mucor mucedo TaxID=29922 RepID=UPI002220E6E6|nr:uncharacterized protein EV154DRAFT_547059 [Mucor mucedo]KAI7896802.1 hypothetical protein EV154DRAFT_547059 [Mucor mucedo]
MIEYGTSTLNKPILIHEGVDEQQSFFRLLFILVTFLLMLSNIVLTTKNYFAFKSDRKSIKFRFIKQNHQNATLIVIVYLIHVVVHNFHFMDNIYRPVDYFEPKYLYQKYILSTMEITFFFNFPVTICGIAFMKKLFNNGYVDFSYLTAYICSSLMTLMHYRIESPTLYAPLVNFSIAGEGVSIFLFICVTFIIQQKPEKKKHKLFIIIFFTAIISIIMLFNAGVVYMLITLVLFIIVIAKLTEGIIYENYERIPLAEVQ